MRFGHARHDETSATVDGMRTTGIHAVAVLRYLGNPVIFDQNFTDVRVRASAVENIDVGKSDSVHVSSDRWETYCIDL
jgi:hypothetical protein